MAEVGKKRSRQLRVGLQRHRDFRLGCRLVLQAEAYKRRLRILRDHIKNRPYSAGAGGLAGALKRASGELRIFPGRNQRNRPLPPGHRGIG